MNLISKYIILSIINTLALTLVTILGIFIAVDYLVNMDEFISAGISLWRALRYVLLKIPFISGQFMPVVFLLATLIVFGLMSKSNELIILNASGISIYTLLKPVLLLSVLFSVLLFYVSESVAPLTMAEANRIKYQEIRKTASVTHNKKNIWIKGPRRITHIAYFHPSSNTIFGFTRYIFDSDFRLVRRIDAHSGTFREGQWILANCMDQTLDKDQNAYHVQLYESYSENLELYPEDFRNIVVKSEEMNIRQLADYVRKVENEGYDATVYRVDLYAKSAYPFVCIIMGLIGIGLTARKKLSKGLPAAISLGIGIAFLYWVFQSFCLSLGYGEIMPPVIAAWAANLIFLCGGVLLLLQAE